MMRGKKSDKKNTGNPLHYFIDRLRSMIQTVIQFLKNKLIRKSNKDIVLLKRHNGDTFLMEVLKKKRTPSGYIYMSDDKAFYVDFLKKKEYRNFTSRYVHIVVD
ncbi:TPA_asm: hypothetical protein [Trichoplax MELD virus]|nr:TPA_asm: hypothetical protein [Trichoplax MELD virus]